MSRFGLNPFRTKPGTDLNQRHTVSLSIFGLRLKYTRTSDCSPLSASLGLSQDPNSGAWVSFLFGESHAQTWKNTSYMAQT